MEKRLFVLQQQGFIHAYDTTWHIPPQDARKKERKLHSFDLFNPPSDAAAADALSWRYYEKNMFPLALLFQV